MTDDHELAAPVVSEAPTEPPRSLGVSGASVDDYTIGSAFIGSLFVEGTGTLTYRGLIEAVEPLDPNPLVESGFERNTDTPAVTITLRDCEFIDPEHIENGDST